MRLVLASCFMGASLAAAAGSSTPHDDIFLGIVEDVAVPSARSPTYEPGLRVAFRHDARGWAPICESKPNRPSCKLPDAESSHPWRVMYEGTPIGAVSTSGWKSLEMYKDAGLLRIGTSSFSWQGTRSPDFAGWADVDVYRPLIALRGVDSRFRAWTITSLASSDRDVTFSMFAKSVPEVPSCKMDKDNKPIGKPLRTTVSDVQVIRVLRSAVSNERLVGMRIRRGLLKDCDQVGWVASDHWYLLSKDRPPRELKYLQDDSGWSASLMPIEIGDFDGDGSDEALFWYSGYNEDGYVLFYSDFSKSIRFTWGYH